MPKRYDTRLIKQRRSYALEEIAVLSGVDKRTCFRWIKEGLGVVEVDAKPLLVMGYELKNFFKKKREKNKSTLNENEMHCFHCKKSRKTIFGSEQINPTGKKIGKENRDQMMKTGLCEVCNGKMYRLC